LSLRLHSASFAAKIHAELIDCSVGIDVCAL